VSPVDASRETPQLVVLAEGSFGLEESKTAASAIRYLPERVTAVLDSEHAGRTAHEVLGIGAGVPVVAGLEEALSLEPRPEALLIGIAPQGGTLPDAWRPVLRRAIDAGLHVWSGLHVHLSEDPEMSRRAEEADVELRDLRKPPEGVAVATGRAAGTAAHRVLTVGTDSNVGKLTTTLELQAALAGRGVSAALAPTGQTGILVAGWGIAVDAVKADFVAGAAETLVLEAAGEEGGAPTPEGEVPAAEATPGDPGPEAVLVEGQGSLLHPGYSGVTMGLLHGSMPQSLVLCWMPGRETIYGGSYDWVELPPIEEVVRLYEEAARWIRPPEPARVVGISLCTYDLEEDEARRHLERARDRTGLPVTDPIRFGPGPLADAVEGAMGR